MTSEGPAYVGVTDTLRFLRRVLPATPGRLLEVGCGRGEVARELSELGWQVLAIDPDSASVDAARARGVDARVGAFPGHARELAPGSFDLLLFVRLLHHVPLEACLSAAARLLRPGGLLVAEDYDWERVDARTAAWACAHLGALAAAGTLADGSAALADEWTPAPGEDAHAAWRRRLGAEGIHGGAAMSAALESRFELLATETAPYFYRYLAKHLPGPDAAEHTSRALEAERAAIEAGRIRPLGQRFVVRRP